MLDAADEAIAPQLAAHGDAIYLDRRLYDRLAALAVRVEAGEVELDPASAYWLERKLLAFERSGVNLPEDDQAQVAHDEPPDRGTAVGVRPGGAGRDERRRGAGHRRRPSWTG